MLGNSWFKKEKPFLGITGLGGGVGSNLVGGASFDASGGIISDYSTPTAVYRSHVFATSGSFVVNAGSADVEYLVIGGGGGGGAGSGAGGGGAGGFRTNMSGHPNAPNNPQTFTAGAGSYAIVVGKGGDAAHRNPIIAQGQPGSNSTITVSPTVTITSLGGGGGGCEGPTFYDGTNGGSGGGGCYSNSPGGEGGANSQGNDGGTGGAGSPGSDYSGGGGGGAGGAGEGGGSSGSKAAGQAGRGGLGLQCEIGGPANNIGMPGSSGFNWFSGGGAGGSQGPPTNYNAVDPAGGGGYPSGGSYAGGGRGGRWGAIPAAGKGRDGTGGGGGGCSPSTPTSTTDNAAATPTGPRVIGGPGGGAPGGYGIVVCRYAIDALGGTAKASGGSISYYNGKVIHAITNPGDFNVSSTIPSAEVVLIGGGGGGGWGALGDGGSGGGGAGAVLVHPGMPFGTGPNAVVIGEGGFGGYALRRDPIHNNKYGDQGESTTFGGLVALGGGFGNGQEGYPGGGNPGGGDGGSGGGGSGGGTPGAGPAGSTANPPAYSGATVYDNDGAGGSGSGANYVGGGGGGAGGAGSGGSSDVGGPGGAGIQLPATFRDPYSGLGDPGTYGGGSAPTPGGFWVGGGGGSGKYSAPQTVGNGGSGGGGQGYGATSTDRDNRPQGCDGMRGTGGGGAGVNYGSTAPYLGSQGGQGGPGIVLVAYPE